MSYRTDRPPDEPEWQRSAVPPRGNQPMPQAADNVAESKTLIYGPRGETLIRQEPRKVGFRKP